MTLRIIAGLFKGRLLQTPKGRFTCPTQGMLREAVFNICQNEIEGARFLDLFAGSGAMGFEALSRGAAHVTFVEQNKHALDCIKKNIAILEVASQTTLLAQNAQRALKTLSKQTFDLIYVDPPYDLNFDINALSPFLAPNGALFLEERYNRKKPEKVFESAHLKRIDSRRFGIALLSQFKSQR